MSEENKGFVIKDKRIHSGDNQEKADNSKTGSSEDAPPSDQENLKTKQAQMPEINFSTFIFSLNSSALVHLGVVEDPATGKKEKNIPFAKQTIDILGILEQKTRGNLTDDEEKLLKNLLHDLRLMYVKENR